MDITNKGARNGVDNGYVSFLPVGAVLAGGFILSKKAKEKKYSNKQTEDLKNRYPPKDSYAEQSRLVATLQRERAIAAELADKSKGTNPKLRTEYQARVKAYDEYLKDANALMEGLKKAEAEITEAAASSQQIASQQAESTASLVSSSGVPASSAVSPDSVTKKTNWLLYGGIAAALLVVVMVVRKRKP